MSIGINGFCDERFEALRDAFIANYDEGLEIGSSLGVTHRGKLVVDLWAGYADQERTRPWERDTIVNVMSTTKVVTATAFLLLIDRGLVELDAPVAAYWPEFAAGGKEHVSVRDALSHQAGVPGLAEPMPWLGQLDWNAVTARIAAEPHWFGGKRRVCYHTNTYGYLLGEIMRRVDGRKPSQFLREEIADKLDADFQIGLQSKSDAARAAGIKMPSLAGPAPGADPELARLAMRISATFAPPYPGLNSWEFQSSGNPAGGGFGNGCSIAKVCSILGAGGEIDGVHYLSREIVAEAGKEQGFGVSPFIGKVSFGLGFALHSPYYPAPSPTTMQWGGVGGSWALVDPRAGISLGYAPNNFALAPPGEEQPRLKRLGAALSPLLQTL